MRRILALVQKELWHHGLVVLGLLALLACVGLLLLLGALVAPRTMTMLETHASFTRFFLPVVALALGNRLVVREYHAGTQRFLEALPVRRVEVVLTKLGVGLALLTLAAMGSLALASLAALSRGEPLTLLWLAIVAFKTELFVLALWSVLFTTGLLGRWRIPLYLGALFLLFFLLGATDVEVGRLGPFALLGERFVLERERLVPREVLETCALIALALGVAFALSLAKEGSVADALARRMTSREKAAVGAVLVFALMGSQIADETREKERFSFEASEVVRRSDPPVEVLYLEPENEPRAEALADVLRADLASLREALALEELPRVHVALRETIDPREVQLAELEDEGAVLVRAAFTHERFDREALRAAVIARVLERATDGRASFEPYAWVRTGLAEAWVRGEDDRDLRRRALFVARSRAPSFAMLSAWERTEERWGPAAVEALAYAAMITLRDRAGRERWLAFARSVLAAPPPIGVASTIGARLDPVSARMEREAGVAPAALDRALREDVRAWRRDLRVPRVDASLAIDRGDLRAIRWSVHFDAPPAPGSTCTLLHATAGPFDAPIAPGALAREERACDALDPRGEALVGRYGSGERVLAAIELDSPELGAPVRVAAARLEVPR